ncbi:GldG family protein [Roseicella frigidaeris]|uniref:Uncharacterized protein n=1 Tax=Roseicella frigidaeris TaxID=2230885 RepID=A0A327MCI1_9PROT|nr:GldG family protein [Roseicella frigidaeris]RAI59982.1 hypothetical protein DOO78_06995 [Roseicella frigidaeris]
MEHDGPDLGTLLWGAGWLVATLVLFVAALGLPLQLRRPRWQARLYGLAVLLAGLGAAVLANLALTLHDAHIDLTREQAYTPSAAAMQAIDALPQEVSLTYFYRGQDAEARRTRDLLQVMARRNPLLKVTVVDPDREPSLARRQSIQIYNAAVIETDGRRVLVQGTDETEIALGIQRALRRHSITACFLEGHGELPMDNFEYHTHLEGLGGHSHGDAASQVVEMPGHGAGRLRRALEAQGYDVRRLLLALRPEVPADCTLLIDASPRTTFLPAESLALRAYLRRGGSALLLFDLGFVVEPELARLLDALGLRAEQQVVVDPLSHYSTDPEMVAVTGYDPHPVTRAVSLTFYPGIRPFTLLPPQAGLEVRPLLSSSRDSYARPVAPVPTRVVEEAEEAGAGPGAGPRAGAKVADATPRAGIRVLGVAAEGRLDGAERPMRAIVIGDGDFASNSFLPYMANSDLLLGAARWLAREERQAAVAARIPVAPLVALTGRQLTFIFVLTVLLMPLLAVALGGIVWWRRR